MDFLKFGDIVLLKFPYSDGLAFKKRPALILNDCGDGDVIVCRITSKIYNSRFDVEIYNLSRTGLKVPSVIRVHKIATLEKKLVELKMGKIESVHKEKVRQVLKFIVE